MPLFADAYLFTSMIGGYEFLLIIYNSYSMFISPVPWQVSNFVCNFYMQQNNIYIFKSSEPFFIANNQGFKICPEYGRT